ncbi:hypothetical protein [Ascidiimonas sp. W6]|uniref:hypothetical protein n=1 Tax=Ascidiimonas meishanensis TaxID=3128903 RepID=UPI0030EF0038
MLLAAAFLSSCEDDIDLLKEAENTNSDLLQISDLNYVGAFRLSGDTYGESSINYASGAMAYNNDNHSIYIVGHAQVNAIAEFPVPALLDETDITALNVSEPLQDFHTVLNAVDNPSNVNRINGMLYKNEQLVINAEVWYDASGRNRNTSLVVRDANNIGTSQIDGYYQMDGAAHAAGYLSPIPNEWHERFNAEYLTGWSSVNSIISRYSYGPSLFTFDLNGLLNTSSNSGSIETVPFMNFSFNDQNYITPPSNDPGEAVWNYLAKGMYGFIVPGTRTFAVFGSAGGIDSGIGYKITQDNGNLCGGYCAYQASDYYNYYWFFDVEEILNAENVSSPRPYAYGKFSIPFDDDGSHRIIGGSFDSSSGLLYLALGKAGQVGQYDRPPLIVGYKMP